MSWRNMIFRIICLIGVGGAIALASGSLARPRSAEPRLKTVEFSDNVVVRIEGCASFQTTVMFGPGEQIENVGLGDANQWQVMPNRRADLLFVKPLVSHAFSNMTVVTARHVYNFELRSASESLCRGGNAVYTLRFHYADVSAATPAAAQADPESLVPPAEKRNSAYTYAGDKDIVPFRIFDDGKSTYLIWAKGVSTPAIYVVGSDNKESLINYTNRGDYVVIDMVGKAFVLRRGDQSATLYNDGFVVPKLDALSPQPAKKAERDFWHF